MKIHFYANYRQVVGAKTVELNLEEGTTIQAMIDAVLRLHPRLQPLFVNEAGQLQSYVHIFVNGRDSQFLPGGMATIVSSSDKIDIFPPVAGG